MMRLKQTPSALATALGLTAAFAISACFTSNDSGPSGADKKESETVAASATTGLQASVDDMMKYDQFEYGKEDLGTLRNSNADFQRALRLDPGNKKALLGSAITGVLLAAQAPKVSSLINQTLDAKSPMDVNVINGAPKAQARVLRKVAALSELPEFHLIQDAIADTLLPALEHGIGQLEDVYDDPAFSMTLTIDGKAREIDHAEIAVFLAGFKTIHALVTLVLAYDIDVDHDGSYDYISELENMGDIDDFSQLTPAQRDAFKQLTDLLKVGSPFLAVRPAWQARLANVDDEILGALRIVKAGIATIKTETDAEDDDIIRMCKGAVVSQCIDDESFDNGMMVLDTGIKYIQQPYVLDIPDLDTSIQVDFAAYLKVQDFKKMLPYYGFYNPETWSNAEPVAYFTDKNGTKTGDINTLKDLSDRAEAENLTAAQVIAELKTIIHFQDPTFQGFLPGATEAGIWNLIQKAAENSESASDDNIVIMPKRGTSTLSPRFALSLLGKG